MSLALYLSRVRSSDLLGGQPAVLVKHSSSVPLWRPKRPVGKNTMPAFFGKSPCLFRRLSHVFWDERDFAGIAVKSGDELLQRAIPEEVRAQTVDAKVTYA
jgi:hypothetical protein